MTPTSAPHWHNSTAVGVRRTRHDGFSSPGSATTLTTRSAGRVARLPARRGRCRRGLALVRVPTIVFPRISGLRATPRRLAEPPGKIHRRHAGLPRGGAAGPARTRSAVPTRRASVRRAGWTRPPRPWNTTSASQDLALLAAGVVEDHPALDRLNEVGRVCRTWAANARHAPGSPRRSSSTHPTPRPAPCSGVRAFIPPEAEFALAAGGCIVRRPAPWLIATILVTVLAVLALVLFSSVYSVPRSRPELGHSPSPVSTPGRPRGFPRRRPPRTGHGASRLPRPGHRGRPHETSLQRG